MYTKSIPFKDFNGKPRNATVHLNLTETEVFKLLREFKLIFNWRESIQSNEVQELDTGEVIQFYTAMEEILLSAYGKPENDGLNFEKSERYTFQSSALFNATMLMFVTDPAEAIKMIDELMPKNMEDLVKTADENLAALAKQEGTSTEQQREIARLQAELAAARAPALPPTGPTGVVPPQG